jgi:ferredoxin
LGTRQLNEILTRITQGLGEPSDLDKLGSLTDTIAAGSLCGLGQTAPNPVLTTLKYFRDEYEAHIRDKSCPAGVCRALIAYYVLPEKCVGCLLCKKNCPVEVISGESKKVHVIDQDKCVKCGACYDVCPVKISAVAKLTGRRKDEVLGRSEAKGEGR